jgi:AhpD family alkylhydroperoxidase
MRIAIDPSRVAETFSKFSDNHSFQESAQLFARGLPIAEMLQAFATNENVLRAFAGFDGIYPHGRLERGILEKVILRVSQLHECQFCVNSHLDIMQSVGITSDLGPSARHTERERLAIEYAELMTRDANRIAEGSSKGLKERIREPVAELVRRSGVKDGIALCNVKGS